MKYIDADLLRKEIERRREANKRQYHSSTGGMSWQRMCGEEDCLVELLAFLDSLQQENEIVEFTFKGGTYRVNGEENTFKGGKAKVIILEINQEEGNE